MIEIRSLKSNELESWFDHCSSVFEKVPRQYFVNHWLNDPWRDIDSIFVAVEDNKILSTVRVFNREIYFDGKKIKAGGIGEVSTIPEARKSGLSTQLLKKAIEYMKRQNINISLLFGSHLNYSKLGWKFNKVTWNISDALAGSDFYNIRKIDFNNDMEEIKNIHQKYTSQFNGTVVREDKFYWTNWIKSEAKNCFVAESNDGNIVGYMCIDIINNTAVVKDFGMKLEYKNVFEELVSYVCNKIGTANEIKYPAVIKNTLNIKTYEKMDYLMIRLICPFEMDNKIIKSTDELIKDLNGGENSKDDFKFLFWNVDSF